MAFLDKVFRWTKQPFAKGGKKEAIKPAQLTPAHKVQSGEVASREKGTGKLAHILMRPHLSEKAVNLAGNNQYVFEVAGSAGKHDIAQAVYDLYRVRPVAVNILNVRGKYTRFGKSSGQTRKWKKAMITLPVGKTIEVYKK